MRRWAMVRFDTNEVNIIYAVNEYTAADVAVEHLRKIGYFVENKEWLIKNISIMPVSSDINQDDQPVTG